ncbi:MAG: hypothetical protein SFW35_09050 [Chitinophagales bacterium]|nr:hypothetical protein [Chitinophagales bacterium]
MIRKLLNLLLIFCVAIGILLGLTFFFSYLPFWKNNKIAYQQPTKLFRLQQQENYDVVINGASRVNLFSPYTNNDTIEKILGRKIFNLGKIGVGVVPNKILLQYFYDKGNKAKHLIQFIDIHSLYTYQINENSDFLADEPFDSRLLVLAFRNGITNAKLAHYYQNKFTFSWINQKPTDSSSTDFRVVREIDPEKVKKRIDNLYFDGVDTVAFRYYSKVLKELVDIAQANQTKVTFVLLPHHLGKLPGTDRVMALLNEIKKEKGVEIYDYTNEPFGLELFLDLDHLNSNGVTHFTANYLKPILEKEK